MAFFHRSPSISLGLDIGTSSIKLVELTKNKRGIRLSNYASAKNTNALTNNTAQDAVARTATIIRAMMDRAGTKSSEIMAALPSLSVFATVIRLPQMSQQDLEQAIPNAAKRYVPANIDDVSLGWTLIEKKEEKQGIGRKSLFNLKKQQTPESAEAQEIFLTAAPRDLVQRYIEVIERLRVKLSALEIESFPLARSLLREETRPTLLVDIGDLASTFSIVDEGFLRLNQSIDVGGAALTQAIIKATGLSEEEAEKRKIMFGLEGSDQVNKSQVVDAMRPILHSMMERSKSFSRLYEQRSKRRVQGIVLIGGGARLRGLSQFWQDVSGMQTTIGNPWGGITVPAELSETVTQMGPLFSAAVGLALRPLISS